jgi:thiol-disulfide isomerase/thioredoxin
MMTNDAQQNTDAVVSMPDTSTVETAVCSGHQPPANAQYCSMIGCPFRPVTLPGCDTSETPYEFYGSDFCTATATVLIVSAGWCVPCMMEAPMIEQLITEGYASRGVRVITVYAQNPDGSTPTPTHCNMWASAYGLTSHLTIDPQGLTNVYTPGNAFPSNLVIDQNGNIYDIGYGLDTGLTAMRADLDAILQAQGR